jgi:hypothetical protein
MPNQKMLQTKVTKDLLQLWESFCFNTAHCLDKTIHISKAGSACLQVEGKNDYKMELLLVTKLWGKEVDTEYKKGLLTLERGLQKYCAKM